MCFVGLNPSTADGLVDDPTVRRCMGFAASWGFDAIEMLNLFAWRATDPADMKRAGDPIGPDNDQWLISAHERNSLIIACWGVHGTWLGRDQQALQMLGHVHHLGLTKHGMPRHPLYLRADTRPEPL